MKKKLVLGGALVLLAALMAWGTWAYFTAEAHVTNVITTGTIDIELKDEIKNGVELKDENDHVVGARLDGVMPGVLVEKTVSVSNSAAETAGDAWVRVKLDISVTGQDKKPLKATFGENQLPVVQIGTADEDGKWVDAMGTDWIASGGYYYYAVPLGKGDTTTELFTRVKLNELLPNDYQGCTVDIVVSAQAVQVKNNNSYTVGDKTVVLEKLTADTLEYINGWPAAD